ncbi:MAG: ATP:cob(I)alamin adenosyltransferase [Ignisphaera sp.]|uniref:ATP:cob(I)alamin adenosyltransferase n=1 Tax=Ignisphaera aggregans TaxID=334771 RepID=A0A7C4NQJ4_9CREN
MDSSIISTVYTHDGDSGDTLVSTIRFPKYHPCLHFIGSVDEALAFIGLAIEKCSSTPIVKDLEYVYKLISKIAASLQTNWCPDESIIAETEKKIDEKPKPKTFIPNYVENPRYGGVAPIAITRTIIRRAERWFWQCFHETGLGCKNIGILLNRLSDFVFVLQYQAMITETSR